MLLMFCRVATLASDARTAPLRLLNCYVRAAPVSVQGPLIPPAELRPLNNRPTFDSVNPMTRELTPARCQAPSKTGISKPRLHVAKGSTAASCN